jgi:hypothetical protein
VYPVELRDTSAALIQSIKAAIAVLLVVGIAVVFLSPVLDLQPTTVRFIRPAPLPVAALVAAALSVYDTSFVAYSRFAAFSQAIPTGTGSLVDLNCTRLC